jgi:hypothetical protein
MPLCADKFARVNKTTVKEPGKKRNRPPGRTNPSLERGLLNEIRRLPNFRFWEEEFFVHRFTIPQPLQSMIETSPATGCKQPFGLLRQCVALTPFDEFKE